MNKLIRHILAISILPGMVTVVIPIWIARRHGVHLALAETFFQLLAQLVGLTCLLLGLVLFVASLRRFANEGRGTLAPWDPPGALVLHGPYRYVRNPMISGVILILFGEALVLLSLPHGIWAVVFLLANLVYIPLVEEPQLERRFGEPYRDYRRHVPRFLPRLKPWAPNASPRDGPT